MENCEAAGLRRDLAQARRRIEAINLENETLRQKLERRNTALQVLTAPYQPFAPIAWGLAGSEDSALRLLAETEFASFEALFAVRRARYPFAGISVVKVTICRLRRKISPAGIVIHNVLNRGYFIAADQRRQLQALPFDQAGDRAARQEISVNSVFEARA